ncbi:glucoamylase family protein [Dyella silvatica]|uniref:glucoamylase family protein n=1 Tax=Dyella silvatica TaxID=2992128 RepID=UPI0022560A48|nr:glucoamylase family protein [Dyella silvatica]
MRSPPLSHPLQSGQQLQHLQNKAFAYFQYETQLSNGLVADKTAPHWPASIAATGLALSSYPIAVERGLLSKQAAIKRTLTTLRFLRDSPQGEEPDATGYRGFYYHFLDMQSGRRAWQCELSTVDSAFLFAGMLAVAAYFNDDSAEQHEIRDIAHALYRRADWPWAQAADGTIGHGWRPESGFIPHRWQGYDEGLLLYVLALGSPTHPLASNAFEAWASTYEWKRCYDIEYLYCGPLFTHQLSHLWLDLRGIQDAFMRGKGIDYFENSRRATQIQQRYAIDNPLGFKGYSAECWGITASDGPGPATRNIDGVERQFYDYEGRGAPEGLDDGTVAPWAVVASLPFAPEIVLPTVHHFIHTLQLHEHHPYGFKASFNQTWPEPAHGDASDGWVSPYFFGLDQGPIFLMVENHRSGMLWELMRSCRWIVDGLHRAGFEGGWLAKTTRSHR